MTSTSNNRIAIVTVSESAPGAVALQEAAERLGYDSQIAKIGEGGVADIINSCATAIFRIGPKTHQQYVDLVPSLKPPHAGTVRASLLAFDKSATNEVLSRNMIATPSAQTLQRGQSPDSFPVVVKILHGNQGVGVELIHDVNEYRAFEDRYSDQSEFLAQQFILEAGSQDKRLIIVRGKLVAAMRRRSTTDDFRANLHTGGEAEAYKPSAQEVELAIRATDAFGLPYAGVDIIDSNEGPLVLEVNPSPGFAISEVTGVDVAAKIIEGVMNDD